MTRRLPPAKTGRRRLLAAALAGCLGAGAAEAQEPTSFELVVPGGTAAVARAAGLDPATEPWRFLPDLTRQLHVSFGERTGARVSGAVEAALAERSGPDQRIPIPLSAPAWDRILGPDKNGQPRDLFRALALDGNAARLYRGLITLDAPTLRALSAAPEALREIYERHSDAFATFAPAFRVQDGRVAVPGGNDESALWQSLVGESVMRPAEFLLHLAAVEGGRRFLFYDTMQRLDDPHRRYAMSGAEPDAARRRERLRALKAAFSACDPWWDAVRPPFSRPASDAPRVLSTVRVTPDGLLAPPNRQVLWAAAFADQVDAPEAWRARWAASPPADAAWLVEQIAGADANVGRSRLGMLAFAQRVFADAHEADPAELLAALRGFGRYRALALTLERMGVRDPARHAAAARQAERLEQAGQGERALLALATFQGSVAVLERARFSGVLDAASAGDLVGSLTRLSAGQRGYADEVSAWFESDLLPALRSRLQARPDVDADGLVLRAMAGAAPRERLQWEGLAYDLDLGAADLARLRAIRRRQGGTTLAEALAARGADRESRLAAVLRDIAYAAAIGPAQGAPASEDVARRHDFGFAEAKTLGGPLVEWSMPREVAGAGLRWHARGSLLALDVGLARLALRRLDTDVPPVPRLSAADRRAVAEGAVVVRAAALDDTARDAIARTLALGRTRLAQAAGDPAALEAIVRELRLRDWRVGTVSWIAANAPRQLESAFSLGEILWLGSPTVAAEAEAWGTSARWDDGCLCARLPRPRPLDELAGRTPDGHLAALTPDLHLRAAELLAEMGLPSRLLPGILTLALQDGMDGANPAYLEDGLGLSRHARTLDRARMEDYVAALVGRGPLVPVAER